MIGFVLLTADEKEILYSHYRKSRHVIVRERAHAILLNQQKKTAYEISRILFRSEKTVREWIKDFHSIRIASIFTHYFRNQNASKLTRKQKEEIQTILSLPPSKHGIPKEFWDVSTLKTYIKAEFGVEYESDESYRLVLKFHNFSFRLPDTFNIRRDEEKIKKRIREIRKELLSKMKDRTWIVLASDETRIVWEAIIRRLWLPKGENVVIKVHTEHTTQSLIGFLNFKTGKDHVFPLSWQNQKEIIKALKKLIRLYPDKHICIVWDNAQFHRGAKLKKALKYDLKQIYLINFPAYAPDYNPQEQVWKWGKDKIANEQFSSLKAVVKVFRKTIRGRLFDYQI